MESAASLGDMTNRPTSTMRSRDDVTSGWDAVDSPRKRVLVFLASPSLRVSVKGWIRVAGVLEVDSVREVRWRSGDGCIAATDGACTDEKNRRWWNVAICTLDALGRVVPLVFCDNARLEQLSTKHSALSLPCSLVFGCRHKKMPQLSSSKKRARSASRGNEAVAPPPPLVELNVDSWDSAFLTDVALQARMPQFLQQRDMAAVSCFLQSARTARLRDLLAPPKRSGQSCRQPNEKDSQRRCKTDGDVAVLPVTANTAQTTSRSHPRPTVDENEEQDSEGNREDEQRADASHWKRKKEDADIEAREFRRIKRLKTYGDCKRRSPDYAGRWYSFSHEAYYSALEKEYTDWRTRPGHQQIAMRFAAGLPPPDMPFFSDWRRLGVSLVNATKIDVPVLLQYQERNGRRPFICCDVRGLETLVHGRSRDDATLSEVFQDRLFSTGIPVDHDEGEEEQEEEREEQQQKEQRRERKIKRTKKKRFDLVRWKAQTIDLLSESITRTWPSLGRLLENERGGLLRLRCWTTNEMQKGTDEVNGEAAKVSVHAIAILPPNVVIDDLHSLRRVLETARAIASSQPARFDTLVRVGGYDENITAANVKCHLDAGITRLRLPHCWKMLADGSLVRRFLPADGNSASSIAEACVHYRHRDEDAPPKLAGVSHCILRTTTAGWPRMPLQGPSPFLSNKRKVWHTLNEAASAVEREFGSRGMRFRVRSVQDVNFFVPCSHGEENRYCIIKGGYHSRTKMFLVFCGGEHLFVHCHSDKCRQKRAKLPQVPRIHVIASRGRAEEKAMAAARTTALRTDRADT